MNSNDDIRRLKKQASKSAKFMSEISTDVFQASDKLETVDDLSKTRDIDIVRLLTKVRELEGRIVKLENLRKEVS